MNSYLIKNINDSSGMTQSSYVDYSSVVVPKSGGTFDGSVSATTFHGNGSNLSGVSTNMEIVFIDASSGSYTVTEFNKYYSITAATTDTFITIPDASDNNLNERIGFFKKLGNGKIKVKTISGQPIKGKSEQCINNRQEGFTLKTFKSGSIYGYGIISETRDKLANHSIISTLSDFPTPINNKINLLSGTTYQINGLINLGENYLNVTDKVSIEGTSIFSSALIYSGNTGAMIRSSGSTITLNGLTLTSLNDDIYDCHGNFGTTFISKYMLYYNNKGIGLIEGFRTLSMDYSDYINNSGGIIIANPTNVSYNRQYFGEASFSQNFNNKTILTVSGLTGDTVKIENNRFYSTSGNTSVSIDTSLSLINYGTVNNNDFTGDGDKIIGINISDKPNWRFYGNTGVDNHAILPIYSDLELLAIITPPIGFLAENTSRDGLSLFTTNGWRHFTGTTFDYIELFSENWESGDFSTNSWITAYDGINTTNQWVVGSAIKSSGSYSAYISKDSTGTAAGYNSTGSGNPLDVNHLYKTFTMPSIVSSGKMNVKFDWACNGENNYDYGGVFWVPTGITINAHEEIDSQYAIGDFNGANEYQNGTSSWYSESIVNSIVAGETGNLVFSFRCDYSVNNDPGFCVDNVKIYYK